MTHAADAEPVALGLDRHGLVGQLHVVRIGHAGLGQGFGELGADARIGEVALHLMFANTKSVLPDGIVERGSDIVSRLQTLGQSQCRDHVLPPPVHVQTAREGHQRIDPRRVRIGAQVSVDRRRKGARGIAATVLARVRSDAHQKLGVVDPLIRRVGFGYRPAGPTHRMQQVPVVTTVAGRAQHLGCRILTGGMNPTDLIGQITRRVERPLPDID